MNGGTTDETKSLYMGHRCSSLRMATVHLLRGHKPLIRAWYLNLTNGPRDAIFTIHRSRFCGPVVSYSSSNITVIKDRKIMPRVWVVNFAGHNHSKAESFGELQFITKGYVSLGSMDRVLFEVMSSIAQTNPDDYMLPCGLLILNVIAAAGWMRRHEVMRVLIWDKKISGYREVKYTGEHFDYLLEHLSAPTIHEEADQGAD